MMLVIGATSSDSAEVGKFFIRSSEVLTALAVMAVPSLNFTPLRRWMV